MRKLFLLLYTTTYTNYNPNLNVYNKESSESRLEGWEGGGGTNRLLGFLQIVVEILILKGQSRKASQGVSMEISNNSI